MTTQTCHCSLIAGIREEIHQNGIIQGRLPYNLDRKNNHFWEEGTVPPGALHPYITVLGLGRNGIQHDSDGMLAPELVRIRIFDTKDAIGLSSIVSKILQSACICVGTYKHTQNCCFKIISSQESTVGLATMSETVYSTLWSTAL